MAEWIGDARQLPIPVIAIGRRLVQRVGDRGQVAARVIAVGSDATKRVAQCRDLIEDRLILIPRGLAEAIGDGDWVTMTVILALFYGHFEVLG